MIDAAQKTELEDLEQLLASDGWHTFTDVVSKLWGSTEGNGARFLEAITAVSRGSDAEAMPQLRQVIAAQREVQAVMRWPADRVKQLRQALPQPSGPYTPSRRGSL